MKTVNKILNRLCYVVAEAFPKLDLPMWVLRRAAYYWNKMP